MPVKNVQITVLIENTKNSAKPKLQAKHGLSFYIRTKVDDTEVIVLMDTGSSAEKLLYNVNELGVKLEDVDAVVLSHGHYDHTGALIDALKQMKKLVPVIGHPTLFAPKLSLKPHLRVIGTPCKVSDLEAVGGVPLLVKGPLKIADGITTTGEIPRSTAFENVKGFWTIQNSNFVNDVMLDDQSLVIDVQQKGLIVVSGCAHSGIINTIKYSQKITGNTKVYAVMGGFHLMSANDKRIQGTIDDLKVLGPEFVGPCHCTGKKAVKMIAEAFGSRCNILHTGDTVNL